jgi:Zinc carboxypeptidase
MNWIDYHSTETIYEWIDALQAEFPQYITVEEIGRSHEDRPMKLVKLSKKQALKIKLSLHHN